LPQTPSFGPVIPPKNQGVASKQQISIILLLLRLFKIIGDTLEVCKVSHEIFSKALKFSTLILMLLETEKALKLKKKKLNAKPKAKQFTKNRF